MNKALQQMAAIWNKLEIAQRVTVVLVGLAFIAAAIFLSYSATQPDYRLLAGNLNQGQVAEIGSYLDSLHVKYRVTDHETAVLVPSKELYRLRNDLAERQMLGDGGKGFELLEKGNMWDSTFSEHKNYDRAVQGELERSMKELPGVRSARVIIDRPQPSPFVGDESAMAKASIKLDMNPGEHLNERQVAGIVHLTAGAVAGLTPDHVQIMDNAGLLTVNTEDSGAMMAQTSLDAEISREQHLTRKAQDILDATLGPGRSRVKVAVKLDFTKRTEATSNPTESKPLKENITTSDERTPVLGQGGIAGTASNIPDGESTAAINPPATASKTMEETHNEYVVGKKTVTQEDEIGVMKGMNVSILLDYKKPETKKLDDKGKPTDETVPGEPYSEAEKKQFAQLVANAIGMDAAKGVARQKDPAAKDLDDRFKVEVQSMGMWTPPAEQVAQATMMPTWMNGGMKDYIGYGSAVLLALALMMVARGQLKRSHKAMLEAEERSRAEAEERERQRLENDFAQPAAPKRQDIKEMIRKRVQENPAAAAQIIRKWINE